MNKLKKLALSVLSCCALNGYAQNPFLPLWEYVPDGEPYVFEDPDCPGQYRVYVYGSHDSAIKEYCGYEQVVWSAPINNLTNWRYDGIGFKSDKDANGKLFRADGRGDMLYAPDVTERVEADGTKTYFLYPNNQEGGRQGMVAKAKRPDGPFEVINWSKTNPRETDGVLRFDPAVFIDDDGRVYGYWGFEESLAAELDPVTMATVKPGTQIVKDMIPNYKQDETFRFFEASSMRKIQDKYVFIYSRWTREGENDLPTTNYTLAYAYSDNPLGPFTYGGTIIDGRGREIDPETGKMRPTATSGGNTHGSIFEANGQWWVVYHRQTGLNEYNRQAMAAPIEVKVEKGKGGKVYISEAEYTSEGFAINGLNPLDRTAAGIACYYTGPTVSRNEYPNFLHSGPYMNPTRLDTRSTQGPFNLKQPSTPVVNCTNGSVIGYKYFNLDELSKKGNATLLMNLIPQGVAGKITIMLDSPYESKGGKVVGEYQFAEGSSKVLNEVKISVNGLKGKKGKHALYFKFSANKSNASLCDIYDFIFVK